MKPFYRQHWKKKLEYDMENQDAIELSEDEWNVVQEGMSDYKNGEVISLKELLVKENDRLYLNTDKKSR